MSTAHATPETRDLGALAAAFAAGRLSRRAFIRAATTLGVSAPLATVLAGHPSAVGAARAQDAAVLPIGPAAERMTFSSFNVDQAPLNIQNNDMDLYLFGLKTAAAKELESGAAA